MSFLKKLVSMQHQSARHLTTKMFKDFTGLSPEITEEIFEFKDKVPYSVRRRFQFNFATAPTVLNGTENVKFISKMCGNLCILCKWFLIVQECLIIGQKNMGTCTR